MTNSKSVDPVEALAKNVRALWKENRHLREALQAMRLDMYQLRQVGSALPAEGTFALFRIIGNDLPPRHKTGQSLDNIRFVLANEPHRPGVTRRWVLNRIVDQDTESAIIDLLRANGECFDRIPIDEAEYTALSWDTTPLHYGAEPLYSQDFSDVRMTSVSAQQKHDLLLDSAYHQKILYTANNNGARNACLEKGRSLARWVLPWDGNCFLTDGAWAQIRTALRATPTLPYLIVPMARITDNDALLDPSFEPEAEEEPQIIFRCDALEMFNANMRYGRRPKIDLLKRLGVPGPWDRWPRASWEPEDQRSQDSGLFQTAGWVARLSSGVHDLEAAGTGTPRGAARSRGIRGLINQMDEGLIRRALADRPTKSLDWRSLQDQRHLFQSGDTDLVALVTTDLLPEAVAALNRGPFSVIDKLDCAPSGDKNDYWHPAPYHWPNPDTPNGLPYQHRDGMRVPGTNFGDPEALRYDRSALQSVFNDTLTLSLATFFTGDTAFSDHATNLIRCWFVDEGTRMNPNMTFAQLILGDTSSRGRGIIEAKDFYFFLDAVSLLHHMQAIPQDILLVFRFWLSTYLKWLETSPQGLSERASGNNHGTAYDLQLVAIAAFLGRESTLQETSLISCQRMFQQFGDFGEQPHEINRPTSKHYCHFNLQLWVNLADLYASCGINIWQFEAAPGRGLHSALRHLQSQLCLEHWPGEQVDGFDNDRSLVLLNAALRNGVVPSVPTSHLPIKNTFDPYSSIRPWWKLGMANSAA